VELAQRYKDADLEAVALAHLGFALVLEGRISEGMAWLDESMAVVSAGEVRDFVAAGIAYRTMIGACERALDFGRAEQWCRGPRSSAAATITFPSSRCAGPTTPMC
jgi:hypothetical protein